MYTPPVAVERPFNSDTAKKKPADALSHILLNKSWLLYLWVFLTQSLVNWNRSDEGLKQIFVFGRRLLIYLDS